MSIRSINFNDKKIKKSDFNNKNKKIFNINNIDISKILISKKEPYSKYNSFKYFIGYKDNDVIRLLYLLFSQTTGYINRFDKNKVTISLMIKDIQLLKNYNKLWQNNEKLMKIDFNNKTIHDDDVKCMKTKLKTFKDSINTNFYNKNGSKKIPEEKVPSKCLPIIILDSIIYACQKYYPQVFLEECKYAKENIKTKNYIDKELKSESESDIDTDTDSDNDIDIDIDNEE